DGLSDLVDLPVHRSTLLRDPLFFIGDRFEPSLLRLAIDGGYHDPVTFNRLHPAVDVLGPVDAMRQQFHLALAIQLRKRNVLDLAGRHRETELSAVTHDPRDLG